MSLKMYRCLEIFSHANNISFPSVHLKTYKSENVKQISRFFNTLSRKTFGNVQLIIYFACKLFTHDECWPKIFLFEFIIREQIKTTT